jgi:XTP/dITP diphosphohydrolase
VTRLLLATGNAHKVAEVQAILGSGYEIEARDPDVEETGATFEDNALLKARAVAAATGEAAVADDSWIPRVLGELDGVPPEGRGCRYVCAAAVAWPDGRETVVRGTVDCVVPAAPRGTGGFGYDPIMVPREGDGRTFAEMTEMEKHALSHRGRAFRALAELL